jgi:hypothetical protein
MRNLSQKIIFILLLPVLAFAQSPHGDDFDLDCELCHKSEDWKVDLKKVQFDHSITKFELLGQHKSADCRSCHVTLEFSTVKQDCIACHTDLHQGTVGKDCSKCHTPKTWMVEDINGLHQKGRFPLVGNHLTADCQSCHIRYVDLYFEPLNTDCYSCHANDFATAHNENESKNCENCHDISASIWNALNVNHEFFPLVGGHEISCAQCHGQGGNYSGLSTECVGCHLDNYNATTNPNHISAGFPTDCIQCHTINGWSPASFDHDGPYFPIYTGEHAGKWNACADCHEVPNNYSIFTCISCHEHNQQEMNDKHQGVQGYIYESGACLSCHPDGTKGNAFNHGNSIFPLTGAHITVNCQDCHTSGYQGTPTECVACHQENFNNSTNPSHTQLGLSTDCATCHTTDPDWQPALFPVHNQYFELLGAHINIPGCNDCHNGNFTNTPNTCIACHQTDFDATTDPPHQILNFSVDCLECHTMNGWTPANFNHSFYIISSQHNDVTCIECHSESNYQPQCLSCHLEDFNEGHNPGDPTDCWGCHTTNNWDSNFDHNNTNFPLTGAHLAITCQDCHSGGYQGTPTECFACHQTNYNNTTNPDHEALMLPTTCESCHTTNTGWQPALFPIHNQFYELLGAHANISNCDDCHNGNYNNIPYTCIGCHQIDYNGTTDPPHQVLNFSFDCLTCHTMNGWIPANFNHSFFPVSNHHNNVNCNECHSEPNYQPQCLSCHLDDFLEEHNQGDPTDCWSCHNASNWGNSFKTQRMQ